MKKQVVISIAICVLCITGTGLYTCSVYEKRLEEKKILLESQLASVLWQIDKTGIETGKLSVAIRPLTDTLIREFSKYPDIVLQMENFFDHKFVKNFSIFDRNGKAYNLFRDENGNFIEDYYTARAKTVIISEEKIVMDAGNNMFSQILPVFSGEVLMGNISIDMDLKLWLNYLYESCAEGVQMTAMFANDSIMFPESGVLSAQADILMASALNYSGHTTGYIETQQGETPVMICYQRLPYDENFVIAVSGDLSHILLSTWGFFRITAFLMTVLTAVVIMTLRHTFRNLRQSCKTSQHLLHLVQTALQDIPLGYIAVKNKILLNANDFALNLLSGLIHPKDIGYPVGTTTLLKKLLETKDDEMYGEWEPFSFEQFGNEISILKARSDVVVGDEHYIIVVFVDVSVMEAAKKNIIRSEIAKSELLSRISTDFKRSIDHIQDAVALLIQKYSQETAIVHIVRYIKLLSESIANMQDFVNIEAGNITLDEVPFNLNTTIEQVAACYLEETYRKNIELQVQIDPTAMHKVVGDPKRFKQILNHLLNNAIKFTYEGKIRITMETTQMEDNKVLVRCCVEDTGIGMSKKQLKNLFSIDIREKEGTSVGLGTIIARQLVNIMGGNILASSPSPISTHPEAPGTQFYFTIQCQVDTKIKKRLDFSAITSCEQIGILFVASDVYSIRYHLNFLERKGIHPDIFIINKDTEPLLTNKLIVDKERYQMVIIEINDGKTGFAVAETLLHANLTEQFIFVLMNNDEQEGNYLKARSMLIDYYVPRDDFFGFDAVLRDYFPNIVEIQESSNDNELRLDLNILIAEDTSLSQTVNGIIFKNLGYHNVEFASNLEELKKKIAGKNYDILFISLKLPPFDGFRAVSILRKNGYNFPVIAMTSTLTKDNIRNIYNSGMSGYIAKPLRSDALKSLLQKWFV
ncbi:MAG: response regulator [Bacteroidales bacterium]|jgi:signal transduction histidine kinase/CheY-like chemotaxis protein|nr:response regulator [Bacteroidales bacterium]